MSSADPISVSTHWSARLDRWPSGWRGPIIAALLVMVTALPGLVFLPPLDRDESRFAQATSQMLETGDFVNIRYQSEPRDKKPVGIHWLQAASVSALSSVEKREIWAYRIPSLLGAMLAAAACAWGAAAFFGPRGGLFAGMALGACLLLSSEAFIAKTDAVLCGAVTLAMAALGRLYLASIEDRRPGLVDKALFWGGLSLSVLDKGPIGPMVAGLALLALGLTEQRWAWIGRLGWGWGFLLLLAVVGPWALAITVATDGGFWTGAVGGDLAPKLAGGHESHGAPPGLHLLALPLLSFPAAALLPIAAIVGWARRKEPAVRFASAWLIPSWIVFEAMPTKLVHYPLPLYGAIAWLMALALIHPEGPGWGVRARWIGAGLSILMGGVLVAVCAFYGPRLGARGSPWLYMSEVLAGLTGLAGAAAVLDAEPLRTWIRERTGWSSRAILAPSALILGVLFHMLAFGGLGPALTSLWVSRNADNLLSLRQLDPRNGVTPGPVAVVGYAEPSLVFLLGTTTELGTPEDAADAVLDGEPALVEKKQDASFQQALKAAGTSANLVGETRGLDYSIGKPVDLLLYRSDVPPPKDDSPPASDAQSIKTAGRPGA